MVVLLASSLLSTACGEGGEGGATSPAGRSVQVVTTVAPITSIVAAVVGGLAGVTGLVPEGADSHSFEPAPSAARTLSQADIVFVNGLKLEEPIRRLATANLGPGAEVVALGEVAITPDEQIFDFSFPRSGKRPNPHLWTSPPLARRYARIVADTMARRDPPNAAAYRANFERFAARVDELDAAMTTATATVAPERRRLLTYHDAYAYFAAHYGWTVVGAIQPSDLGEPTPREVGELITQIRTEKVPAIFGSEVFSSPVLEQIGRETGARYVDVLRDDDLPGRPGDPEHSWLGLMRFDFITMVESLGGDARALASVSVAGVGDDADYPQ